MKDYYKILGVPEDASEDEIRRAFFRLAHKYHPDKGGDPEKFKEINEAYQVLSDKKKREEYDRARKFGGEFEPGIDYSSFDFTRFFDLEELFKEFKDFFGEWGGFWPFEERETKRENIRENIVVEVSFSLEDSFFGGEKEIEIKRKKICEKCHGEGVDLKEGWKKCDFCQGRGKIESVRETFWGTFRKIQTCPHCGGRGKIAQKICSFCKGKGEVEVKEKVRFFLPRGIADGEIIKIPHKGNLGGDLYIKVKIKKHPLFERKGDDLLIKREIKLSEALLGGEIEVPTIEGKKIKVKIPPLFDRKELRVKGKGMPHRFFPGRGDLILKLKIKLPKKLTKEQKKLIEKLKEKGL